MSVLHVTIARVYRGLTVERSLNLVTSQSQEGAPSPWPNDMGAVTVKLGQWVETFLTSRVAGQACFPSVPCAWPSMFLELKSRGKL